MKDPLTIKLTARLFSGDEKCFGPGVASLLEGIDREGSLRAAASGMGMAYSKAWTVLRQCEQSLELSLLDREVGGKKGGASRLTPSGRVLLEHYRKIETQLKEMGQALMLELNESWVEPDAKESTMVAWMNLVGKALSQGHDLTLATVTARAGSAPRGAGARMLVGRDGRLWGTVGGGLVERQTQLLCAQALEEKRGVVQEFSLDADEAESIGMVCGGKVTILIQYLSGENPSLLTLSGRAKALLDTDGDGWVLSHLDERGQSRLELCSIQEGIGQYPALGDLTLDKFFVQTAGGHRFAQRLSPGGTVYVFGGGHVARDVSPLLTQLDFPHVVIDDRVEFSRTEDFPGAKQVLCADFQHILDQVSPGASDYAVVMTRGHRFDTEVQRQLLTTPVGYIGVMGSQKKKAFVSDQLRSSGFTDEDLARIVTPIGLPIGGETPAEIALSIAAQLVQLRAEKEA